MALALNIGFDQYYADFGANETNLADLTVVAGKDGPVLNATGYQLTDPETGELLWELTIDPKFDGLSVQDIMDIANDVLGGTNTEYTPSEICDLVAAINENLADGEIEAYEGFLTAPATV